MKKFVRGITSAYVRYAHKDYIERTGLKGSQARKNARLLRMKRPYQLSTGIREYNGRSMRSTRDTACKSFYFAGEGQASVRTALERGVSPKNTEKGHDCRWGGVGVGSGAASVRR